MRDAIIVFGDPLTYAEAPELSRSRRNIICLRFIPAEISRTNLKRPPELTDLYRRAGDYIDMILRVPSLPTLPVEQPTKFELVINNMKTAKALGLTVPFSLLLRTDHVR